VVNTNSNLFKINLIEQRKLGGTFPSVAKWNESSLFAATRRNYFFTSFFPCPRRVSWFVMVIHLEITIKNEYKARAKDATLFDGIICWDR
jgi:hypothetical protein